MAFFTTRAFTTSKEKGTGGATIMQQHRDRLSSINSDDTLVDPLTGEPISDKYFDAIEQSINLAMGGASFSERTSLKNELTNLQRDRTSFAISNVPLLQMTEKDAKSDVENWWRNLWSVKETLTSGQYGAMASEMENYVSSTFEQLKEYRGLVASETQDKKMLGDIDSLIKFYSEQSSHWRGVYNNPDNYAVLFDTDKNGDIRNFQIKDKRDIPSGFGLTDSYTQEGLQIGGYKTEDEDGIKRFQIGNVKYSERGKTFVSEDKKQTLDYSSFRITDWLNVEPGAGVIDPKGRTYIKKQDGSWARMNIPQPLTESQAKEFGVHRYISIPEEDALKIESSYDVEVVDSNFLRTREAKEAVDKARQQAIEEIGYDPGKNVLSNAMDRMAISPAMEKFRTGAAQASTAPLKFAGETMGEALKTAQAPRFAKETMGQAAVETAKGAQKAYQASKSFFKGVFVPPDKQ